jgi:hypothetical protein
MLPVKYRNKYRYLGSVESANNVNASLLPGWSSLKYSSESDDKIKNSMRYNQ